MLDALTINVTKLFRNWPVYASLFERVIPLLWEVDAPRIRIWSAGCSSGEEAYSIGVLLHQYATLHGRLAQMERIEILGTDIDRASLAAAARGQFKDGDFAETPAELRERYFSSTVPFTVSPAIAKLARFERRDLLEDGPPPQGGGFHLIACRNVLIYFDRETRNGSSRLFIGLSRPAGFSCSGRWRRCSGRRGPDSRPSTPASASSAGCDRVASHERAPGQGRRLRRRKR